VVSGQPPWGAHPPLEGEKERERKRERERKKEKEHKQNNYIEPAR